MRAKKKKKEDSIIMFSYPGENTSHRRRDSSRLALRDTRGRKRARKEREGKEGGKRGEIECALGGDKNRRAALDIVAKAALIPPLIRLSRRKRRTHDGPTKIRWTCAKLRSLAKIKPATFDYVTSEGHVNACNGQVARSRDGELSDRIIFLLFCQGFCKGWSH